MNNLNGDTNTKKILVLLFCVFIAVSVIYIRTGKKKLQYEYRSSELKRVVSGTGNQERTDYFDADGHLVIAADLGFATKVVTKEGNTEFEEYYDAEGNRIGRYSGFFAILREYDEKRNNTCITYLDAEGNPTIILDGYAIAKRTYDDDGKVLTERYYNPEGEPICTKTYGYGKSFEYNEKGTISRIIYTDRSGNPMMPLSGYAVISRSYYSTDGPENGKTEYEFYFDAGGKPAIQSIGQYGIHKEYNESGQISVITYLDKRGKPITTNKGYTTVKRTFKADGTIATERYFDSEGRPYKLSEGQYGFKWQDGKMIYLDENGNEQLNLKNILYIHSWLVILIAIAAMFLSVMINKNANLCLLIICIISILYLTLMNRSSVTTQSNITIFSSFWRMFFERETRANVLRNIWLFLPLGAILFSLFPRKKILLIPVALSVIIEGIQYFTGIGYCDGADVICNSFGALTGFMMADVITGIKSRFLNPKKRSVQLDT